jgi:hypothetical protein
MSFSSVYEIFHEYIKTNILDPAAEGIGLIN